VKNTSRGGVQGGGENRKSQAKKVDLEKRKGRKKTRVIERGSKHSLYCKSPFKRTRKWYRLEGKPKKRTGRKGQEQREGASEGKAELKNKVGK